MSPTCYDLEECAAYGRDQFGGHTKALQGFSAYNIEGAEITAMGQTTTLGRYPIHFHMCLDTTDGGEKPRPVIKGNSIHDTFR